MGLKTETDRFLAALAYRLPSLFYASADIYSLDTPSCVEHVACPLLL